MILYTNLSPLLPPPTGFILSSNPQKFVNLYAQKKQVVERHNIEIREDNKWYIPRCIYHFRKALRVA